MGNTVIKCAPDADRYVVWNGVADGPEFHGDRVATARYLSRFCTNQGPAEGRLAYADEHGSSSRWGANHWGEDVLIAMQIGVLRRPNLWEFCGRYFRDDKSWRDLLEPFEDDEPSQLG